MRSTIGAPGTTDSPGATRARSPGASGNVDVDRAVEQPSHPDEPDVGDRCERRLRAAGVRRCPRDRSRIGSRPQRRLPGRQQVAPTVGAVRQPQRDVAQVDHEAARGRPRRRSRNGGRARPSRTRSRNLNSATAVEPGGRSTSSRPPGTSSSSLVLVADVDDDAAGRLARPQAGRRHDAAERREEVVDEVREQDLALPVVRDRPERAEQPGVVERVLAGARPAHDVDVGQRHRRRRDRRPDPARHDHAGPARGRGRSGWWPPPAARGPPAPRPSGARRPRRPRPPTARCAARASGRARDAGRPGTWTTRGCRRSRRRPARPGRPRRPARRPTGTADARPPEPGIATARAAASWPRTMVSMRRSRTSASVRVPAPSARRGSSAGRASSSSRSASGSGASGSWPMPSSTNAAGASMTATGSGGDVAEDVERLGHRAPDRMIGTLRPARRDRRDERRQLTDAATLVGTWRIARADDDRLDRRDRAAAASSPAGRSSRRSPRSSASRSARPSRRGRPASARNRRRRPGVAVDGCAPRACGSASPGRPTMPSATSELRVGAVRVRATSRSMAGSRSAPAGIDEAADEPPRPAGTADQRDRDRRGAVVDREECVRLRRHRQMLPGLGRAADRRSGVG